MLILGNVNPSCLLKVKPQGEGHTALCTTLPMYSTHTTTQHVLLDSHYLPPPPHTTTQTLMGVLLPPFFPPNNPVHIKVKHSTQRVTGSNIHCTPDLNIIYKFSVCSLNYKAWSLWNKCMVSEWIMGSILQEVCLWTSIEQQVSLLIWSTLW